MSAPNRRASAPRRGPARVLSRPAQRRSTSSVHRRGPIEPSGPHAVELAGLLHELSVRLLAADTFTVAMERLATLAATALPGVARCSVALVGDGGPLTRVAHGAPGEKADDLQYESGSGPGWEATRARAVVSVPDLPGDQRWPEIAVAAAADGIFAMAAVPLDVQRADVGAINLFLDDPSALTPDLLLTAMALAGQAEVLLSELRRREALSAGAAVDRAAGVIIAQRNCGVQEAYDILRDTAQRLGLDRRAVAERLIAVVARNA